MRPKTGFKYHKKQLKANERSKKIPSDCYLRVLYIPLNNHHMHILVSSNPICLPYNRACVPKTSTFKGKGVKICRSLLIYCLTSRQRPSALSAESTSCTRRKLGEHLCENNNMLEFGCPVHKTHRVGRKRQRRMKKFNMYRKYLRNKAKLLSQLHWTERDLLGWRTLVKISYCKKSTSASAEESSYCKCLADKIRERFVRYVYTVCITTDSHDN